VIAHRGASAYKPENTLPAYALAVEMQADMIEIDLHRTRDGAIVVTHDEALAGIGGRGEIAHATLAEIRRLSRMGHDVITIHVLARDELSLCHPGQWRGATEFVDLESGATLVASPETIADEYARAVREFLERTERALAREGLDYVRLVTGDPLEPALRRFLIERRGSA
jgi:glycerophosphoryl diester phosphodiesterase